MTEPQYQCPKCHQNFSASLIHNHFTDCKGVPQPQAPPPMQMQYPQAYPVQPQQPSFSFPQPQIQAPPGYVLVPQHQAQPQVYVPPAHQHTLAENDSFKWCVDPACPDKHRFLRLKIRGTWFLFVRYGLKLFWIQFLVSIILALGLVSEFHIGR